MMRPRSLFCFFFLLAGCGYHWGLEYPEGRRPTVVVPYAKGDEDGTFTSALASALTESGLVDVRNRSGDYRIEVCLDQNVNEQIGYRRDPQKIKNKIKKNLLASEGRRTLEAKVTLYRGLTDEVVSGPYHVVADVDYDYVDGDSYQDLTFISKTGETIVVLPFSLGQLESVESAQEASTRPLFKKMAQKIVDVISSEW